MIDEVTFTDAEWERMLSDPAFGYVCRLGHRLSDSDRRFIEVEGICPSCFAEAEADYAAELADEVEDDPRPLHLRDGAVADDDSPF